MRRGSTALTPVPLVSPVGTIDVANARLMFWDLGGQEELQSLWDKVSGQHCHVTNMLLTCYSSANNNFNLGLGIKTLHYRIVIDF